MNRQQLAMRVQALSSQIHQTERIVDQRRAQRDMAQNRVNGIKNFLTTVPPNHPRTY
jgi:outer membrane murein-binding lipoprotein Lpp